MYLIIFFLILTVLAAISIYDMQRKEIKELYEKIEKLKDDENSAICKNQKLNKELSDFKLKYYSENNDVKLLKEIYPRLFKYIIRKAEIKKYNKENGIKFQPVKINKCKLCGNTEKLTHFVTYGKGFKEQVFIHYGFNVCENCLKKLKICDKCNKPIANKLLEEDVADKFVVDEFCQCNNHYITS